jgi:porin
MRNRDILTLSAGFSALCGLAPASAADWQGFADTLSAAGVRPAVTYEGGPAANLSGGETRGATYTNNLSVQLSFDGNRLIGVPGLSAYLDGLWIAGGDPSKLVGDAQGVSNIAGPGAVRIYEAWVQYNVPSGVFSVLAGRYDLNTEFYHLSSADLFLNSSFGIGAAFGLSGFAGPSVFPDTTLGVRLGYKPSANSVLRLGVLDGAPLNPLNGSPDPFSAQAGVLLVAEAALLTRPVAPDTPGGRRYRIGRRGTPLPYDDKIAVGAWYYTATFNEPGPASPGMARARHSGEGGAYLVLDRILFQSAQDPARRLTGFVQAGIADQVVDRFGSYIGAGVAVAGLVPGRPGDQFGLAMAMARNGSEYLSAEQQAVSPVAAAETAVELTYQAELATSVSVQPDLQYVIHPNTDPRLRNALVAQLRVQLSF